MSAGAPVAVEHAVGALLRDLPPLFTTEKPISFDPVQTVFLQTLVREGTLGAGIAIRKQDFFKGVVYLDYFSEVVAGRPTVLEDAHILVEELEKLDQELDPDLELLVRYSGLYTARELKAERFFRPASLEAVRRRHERTNTAPPAPSSETLDLFHLAAGRMVRDLVVAPEAHAALSLARRRNDLKAAIVADCLLALVPEAAAAAAPLATGDPVGAVTGLLERLAAASADWSLKGHVERLRARLGG